MKKDIIITEGPFRIIQASEEIEGFRYTPNCKYLKGKAWTSNKSILNKSNGKQDSLIKKISERTVADFLDCDGTKVSVVEKRKQYYLVAKNTISNETILIKNIGNHFMAFIDVVKKAMEVRQQKKENDNVKIISNDFIKKINETILLDRKGEVGIGEYRYLDRWGRNVDVAIGERFGDEVFPLKCVELEKSALKNVYTKMNELVNWTNEKAFKNPNQILYDVAEFHARFVKIHPFRDGNGRTARLLTNYLLLVNGKSMINIPSSAKEEYNKLLNYANASSTEAYIDESDAYKQFYERIKIINGERKDNNKYFPLMTFFKRNSIKNCNTIVGEIINYMGEKHYDFEANQVMPKNNHIKGRT